MAALPAGEKLEIALSVVHPLYTQAQARAQARVQEAILTESGRFSNQRREDESAP